MNQLPLLLIDVDGVTNLFGAWLPGRRAPKHLNEAQAAGYRLLLNPEHPQWFAELEPHFEQVHATMWQGLVYEYADVADYGHDWDYIDFDFHQNSGGTDLRTGMGVTSYKWPGLMATMGNRPTVYVDDDLTEDQLEWAERRNAAGIPTLFIQPHPSTGMTREHFEQIKQFASMFDTHVESDKVAS